LMTVGTGVTDGGALIVAPSDDSRLTLEMAALTGEAEAEDIVFDIASDALRIALAGDGSFDVSAASFAAAQAEAGDFIRGGLLEIDDLSASGAAGPDGALTAFEVTAPRIRNAYRITEDGVQEISSDQTYSGLNVSYATDTPFTGDVEAFLAEAVERGRVELTIAASGTTGASGVTGGPSAPPMDFTGVSGALEGVFSIIDGRIRYAVKADATDVTMAFGAPSPFPGGKVTFGDMAFDLTAPMRKADGPQPYKMTMNVAGVEMDEAIWAAFDAGGAIPRGPIALNIDIGGAARVLFGIGENTFGQTPLDVETLEIRDVSLEGMGVAAAATGALEIAGDASQPEGDVRLDVWGAFALLDAATAAGLLPPGQGDLYKQLALSFAQVGDDGPDHLVADISTKDGGVSVNGTPLQ
ncbi:MAG: DUF2125 domain-containing protein, partial [Pseudomonadota bacterium]